MLNSRQRAYLNRLSHDLPALVQIGKDGESPAFFQTVDECMSRRELLKATVLKTCPLPPREAADRTAEAIGADVVRVIGRRFVLYRPNEKLQRAGEGIVLP